MADEQMRKIFIETHSGDRFEADIPCDTKISQVAADFFESQKLPLTDRHGHGYRGVVDLVDPGNPDNTKRLNSDRSICDSGLKDGDTLRINPESRAGAVDYNARLSALTVDYNEMLYLREQNPELIDFTPNHDQAPDFYTLKLYYKSFIELSPQQNTPRQNDSLTDPHRVEIMLDALYPRRAPIVTWKTPIFHPNIRQPSGAVCLGVLQERYLPGMGLARLVRMLIEIVQWRNFDAYNAFNPQAALWASSVENWPIIEEIGGHPLQGPLKDYIDRLDPATHKPIVFKRLSAEQ